MSMKVLRCLGIRKRHMARKSPCFLRSLSSRSGPNVPLIFFILLPSRFLLVKVPSHGCVTRYSLSGRKIGKLLKTSSDELFRGNESFSKTPVNLRIEREKPKKRKRAILRSL